MPDEFPVTGEIAVLVRPGHGGQRWRAQRAAAARFARAR